MKMEPINVSTALPNKTYFDAKPFQISVWWNVLFSISAVSTLTSVYLFISLILYLIRKNFKRSGVIGNINRSEMATSSRNADFNVESVRTSRYDSSSNSIHIKFSSKMSITAQQVSQIMHIVLLVTLALNIMRGIAELFLFFFGGSSDRVCYILTSLMIGFTGFAIHGGVVFLWLRQHIFYISSVIKQLSPKGRKYISLITYLEMIVTISVCLGLHLWWRDYTTLDGICRPVAGSERVSPVVSFGLVAFSTVTIQISLTFLFVYPLFAHKKQIKGLNENNPKSRSTARLLSCIRRTLIAATIGITTDILGSLISIALPSDMPVFVVSVIYELDILLNIFCLFYTYQYWRDIVFPWRLARKNRQMRTTSSNFVVNHGKN